MKLETASSSVSNGKSTNIASVSSLSQQGTTVASQWVQFFHRDVTNRLAALRRSQMRVQDVIQTELPSLLANEFSLNPENVQLPLAGCPISVSMDIHQAKWNSMFHQMDKALKEEANRLFVKPDELQAKPQCNCKVLHCDYARGSCASLETIIKTINQKKVK
ncbi:hypothetical protein RCOM_1163400 [Ricinus communis]|uniref:Uncharacterized protein n=1 Tax=Ricinus communis TaxID=3988 RepID=B9SD78_RICCO|nr:hypothetical protein RCOM_1163400 [Ricinus communis]